MCPLGAEVHVSFPKAAARPVSWAPTPNPACWLNITARLLQSRARVRGCRVLWLPPWSAG